MQVLDAMLSIYKGPLVGQAFETAVTEVVFSSRCSVDSLPRYLEGDLWPGLLCTCDECTLGNYLI